VVALALIASPRPDGNTHAAVADVMEAVYAADVLVLAGAASAASDRDVLPPWFHVPHAPGGPLGGVFNPR
jgi:hypothetical protein